jgi:hypothetical protein
MKTEAATSLDEIRHRLLEGVLLRLARRPDASAFVVRGGMLMSHWFKPVSRLAEDLDLIASFPVDAEQAASRITALLADRDPDGVAFDPDSAYAEEMHLDTGPGVRIFAAGVAGGVEAEFHVDVTFGPRPRPAPVFDALPTACGEVARVWMCRPEAVAGHKMQALWNRGLLGWRPKDLEDLRLLLTRIPMDSAELRGAILGYLADVGATVEDARALFGPAAWLGTKLASARWLDFVRSLKRRDVPRDLAAVVAEVAGRLSPILEEGP